ncbi:MAG: tetratricopeptide repeat-containing sulfotransferase family protein [Cellvibrionaceae bacterium]
MNPREVFFKALNAFKQKQFEHAEELCKKLLKLNPREVNSLRLYGQIQVKHQLPQEAEKAFLAALEIAPDYAHAHMDLGELYLSQGLRQKAVDHLEKACQLDSRLHSAKRILQRAYEEAGYQKKAEALNENFAERADIADKVKQAFDLQRQQNFVEMENLCHQILQQDPGNLAVISLLAEHTVSERQAQRAAMLFEEVVTRMPDNWRAWNGLGRARVIQADIEAGHRCFDRSLEINPDAIESQVLKADAYAREYQYSQAIALLEKAVSQDPNHNPALSQLGLALKTVGEQDRAIEVLRRCIANDELYGEAYWTLSDMKTFTFDDDEVTAMDRIFSSDQLTDSRQVQFGYALGKAMEHRKQYHKAFSCYDKANRVQKRLLDYSAIENQQSTNALIENITAESLVNLSASLERDVTPIFIVGLPRSGSTLQEQILASHSQVEGTEELSYMPRLSKSMHLGEQALTRKAFPQCVDELSAEVLNTLGTQYLQQADKHRVEKRAYFIDKLPNNFVNIGLILSCFPNAKIINTRRHPMDNCLGCFKQLWALGQHFTYSLEDLGHYYNDYHRLMLHWHKVFPGRILDVQYESVVDDLENNVRRVLDFCGLEFEQGCVNFHETKRAVKTSSSEQVRKPIYRSALAYWKNFETELEPLRKVLGDLATQP